MGANGQSEPAATQRRRGQLVVDGRFQFRTVLSLMGCVFVAASFTGLVLVNVYSRVARSQFFDPEHFNPASWRIVIAFGLTCTVLCAVGFGIWCLLFTHRISGPIYVMHQWVRHLKEGKYPETRSLRKSDQFQAFSTDLADVIRILRSDAHAQMTGLQMALDDLRGAASAPDDAARSRALADAIERIRNLHERISVSLPGGEGRTGPSAASRVVPRKLPTADRSELQQGMRQGL